MAFVWTERGGLVPLGELPGGEQASEPFGMSPDGAVIVGKSASKNGVEAFRWTPSTGMKGLGDLPRGDFQSMAFDVSAGGTVVGMATAERGPVAFIWDAQNGLRSLESALSIAGVRTAEGWQLTEATAISADGRTIVGSGTNPDGKPEGWVAHLP